MRKRNRMARVLHSALMCEGKFVADEHVSTCRGSATETQHIQCGGGPAPPLWPPSCWRPPSWPAQPERTAELQSPAEGRPPPRFWGSENVEKTPFEIMGALNAHRNSVREMGPECRCAVRNATATRVGVCVRRVGCKTYTCRPPQTATLPEGVRHVMGRAKARGGSLREHRLRRGAPRMRSCRMRSAPFRRCVVQVGRAVHLFGSCCATRPMRAEGGGGKCAPCRRGLSPAPASAKTWPMDQLAAVGAKKCGIKRGGWWGH